MTITTIKITELNDIGTDLDSDSVFPVVNMTGAPVTEKTVLSNIANVILEGAGIDYSPVAVAARAGTVTTAAQPNITSTGTLTSLTVTGNIAGGNILATNLVRGTTVTALDQLNTANLSANGLANIARINVTNTANLGGVGNITITGGSNGQVLTTNGTGSLSWTTVSGGNSSYGNSDVANYLPTFTGNIGANVVTANLFAGSGANLTNIPAGNISGTINLANYATTANAVAGANVTGTVGNANLSQYLNVSDVNNNFSYHVVLSAGSGDKSLHIDADDNLQYNPADGTLTATRVDATYVLADLQYSNGYPAANVTGLGNIATINLTGSNSNVLYGNGVFAAVSGGGANTGNVTFSNNIVIGTGDPYGGSGLYLAIGPDSVANSQYLQVRGGDNLTHIHLDTGNNQFYDQYFGDDAKYVKLELGDTGNVVVGTDDATGNSYRWTFTSDGNFILANGNSVIQSIANSSLDPVNPNVSTMVLTPDPGYSTQSLVLDPTLPGHIHLRAPSANIDEPLANIFLGGEESSFEVGYYNGAAPNLFIHSNTNTWTFENTGNLELPVGGNLNFNLGGITQVINQDLNIVVQDEEDDGWSLYNTITDSLGNNLSRTQLDSGSFTITTDITGTNHSWSFEGNTLQVSSDSQIRSFGSNVVLQSMSSGSGGTASLQSVSNTNDPNIFTTFDATTTGANITVYNGGSNSGVGYTWSFANDGNLTLPQLTTISDESGIGTTLTVGVPPTVIVISGADFSAVNTTYTKTSATTPTWEPAGYNPATDPYIEFSGGEYGIFAPSFGQALYVNTGTLNVPLTQWNTNPPLGSVAPTAVYTYGASGPDWVFGADGYLTLPGNLVIAGNANVFGANRALIQPANDLPLIALSSGANGAVSSVWVEDIGNVGTSNIAAVYANPTSGSGIVRIVVGQNGGNAGPNLWDFNANGTLTFPGTPRIDTDANNFEVQAAEAINFEANTVVNIYTDTGNTTYQWQFGDDGVLTVPGNLVYIGASPAPSISGFNSVSAEEFTNDTSNVTINANSNTWNFDSTGNLTIPSTSGGFIKTASNASIGIVAMDNGTNNPAQLLSMNVGNGNATSIVSAYSTNVAIQTNASGAINTWKFDNAGNLTLPANTFAINYANGTQVSLSASSSNISNGNSNVTIATSAGNVVTNVNGSAILTTYSGGIKVGGSGILQSPGGASAMTLNNNGANIPTANITNTLNVTGAGGANITANLTAGNISTGGVVSATGNISGNFFIGNGSQLTGITATSLVNGTSNVVTTINGNVTIGIAGNAAIATFTGTGANVTGTLNTTGNVTAQGTGSNIIRRAFGLVAYDTTVTLDDLSASIPSTGIDANKLFLQTSGGWQGTGWTENIGSGAITLNNWTNLPLSSGFAASAAISSQGNGARCVISDQTPSAKVYQITVVRSGTTGSQWNISIERLV